MSQRSRGHPFRRRMIAEDEVTSARALRILGYRSANTSCKLTPLSRELVRLGAGASRPTWAYRRADIERIAHIRKVTGLSLRSAVRVRLAELAGTL